VAGRGGGADGAAGGGRAGPAAVDPAGVGTVAPFPAGVVGTVGAWGKRLSFLPLSETEYLTPWTLISVVGFVPPAASGCLLMPAAAVF